MKNVAKVILSTIIGVVLWVVFNVLFLIVLGLLFEAFEPFAILVNWIYASKFYGHLVPVVIYAIPCILPGWVVNKLHHGGGKVRKAAQWAMCGTVAAILLVLRVLSGYTDWFELIEGMIGVAIVFSTWAQTPEEEMHRD